MRALTVWWEGAVVGSLTADRHGAMGFAYDGGWVADPFAAALAAGPRADGECVTGDVGYTLDIE